MLRAVSTADLPARAGRPAELRAGPLARVLHLAPELADDSADAGIEQRHRFDDQVRDRAARDLGGVGAELLAQGLGDLPHPQELIGGDVTAGRPPAGDSIALISRSATSRTSTKLKPIRGIPGIPFRSRSITCSENERSSLSTGPRIAPGLTTATRSSAPFSRARSQAARSATVFDRTYGESSSLARSVQSSSVRLSESGLPLPATAATEEVMTIRSTPPSSAARSTRRVPSRAGTISSSGSFGWAGGNGEATWRT